MSSQNSVSHQSKSTNLLLPNRPRRLRRTPVIRRMVRETQLSVNDLIYPLFVMEGESHQQEIISLPGCYRYSGDLLLKEVENVFELGINAIALFPVIPEDKKDATDQYQTGWC